LTINAPDFRQYVVEPAHAALVSGGIPRSLVADNQVIATGAVETLQGTFLVQENSGPGLGLFQIEPQSLDDLLAACTPSQIAVLDSLGTPQPPAVQIVTNLVYAAAICRLYYWQVPAALPPNTLAGLYGYWKLYYNTPAGAGTLAQFTQAIKLTDIVFT
jgi:hypothetical protein